jgi:hypothetical protein
MKDKNTPAFPGVTYITLNGEKNPEGMHLRDYFAAKALPLAFQMEKENTNKSMGEKWYWDGDEDFFVIALMAYGMADAMMKARDD